MRAPIAGSDAEQTALAKVYLLGSLTPGDRASSIDQLRRRAETDLGRLVALRAEIDVTAVPPQLRETARFRLATLDYGIRAHELMVRWLNELEFS